MKDYIYKRNIKEEIMAVRVETEMDKKSAERYRMLAAWLDEEQAATSAETSTGDLGGIPDLGAAFQARIGFRNHPYVTRYEGREVVTTAPDGRLQIEIDRHPDLANRALVIDPLDDRGDEYFIMLLSAATNPAVSTMDWNDPNREYIRDTYGVLPAVHSEDPLRGIHFQGTLRYPSNVQGVSSMKFTYEPEFIPHQLESEERAEYERQQRRLAGQYLLPQPMLEGKTLLEGMLNPTMFVGKGSE